MNCPKCPATPMEVVGGCPRWREHACPACGGYFLEFAPIESSWPDDSYPAAYKPPDEPPAKG